MNEFANWLVKFETPAFLGNVDQQGQWRTPQFKALLREWWRISHRHSLGGNNDQVVRAQLYAPEQK